MSTGTIPLRCRYFSATGNCKYGDRCWFEHRPMRARQASSLEPSASSTQMDNPSSVPQDGNSRNKECRYFKAGRCMKGNKCSFSHDIQAEQGSSSNYKNQARSTNIRRRYGKRKAAEEQRKAAEAQLEKERARKAHLEVARKAKQMEIVEREASITIRRVVMDGSTLVTCGAGLDVRHIVCGFESCLITIKNLPRHVKLHDIEELLTRRGLDINLFCVVKRECVNDKVEAKVMLDFEHVQAVVAELNGMEFQGKSLAVYVDSGGVPNKMDSASEKNMTTITITWKLSTSTMVAQYVTTDDALDAVQRLNNTIFYGRRIRAKLYQTASNTRYAPSTSVEISGLPLTATIKDVENHSGAYLVWNLSAPSAVSSSREVGTLLRNFFMWKEGFESYDLSPPDPDQLTSEARVRFRTWDDAKRARNSLDDLKLGVGDPQLHAWLPNPIQYVITIPLSQYRAQKARWDSLPMEGTDNKGALVQVTSYGTDMAFIRALDEDNKAVGQQGTYNGAFVQVTSNGIDTAFIRVLGEDKKAVGQLKVRVENLVAGETIDPGLWRRSFLRKPGKLLLEDISARSKTYVRADRKSKTLKLYADGHAKQVALALIRAEVARLESLKWSIPIARRAIGFFMRKGLRTLKEELGEDAATFELLPIPRLIIRAGKSARRTVKRLIAESRMSIKSEAEDSEQDICPICFDEVTSPVMLSCGHAYCTACFLHFLSSAAERRTFPLVCFGDEDNCKAPITIPIIQRYLLPQQFDQLVEAAAEAYIEKQPTKFRYCTTPDCPQVYHFEEGVGALTCPSCFATVCTECHKEAHGFMTCREREILDNPDEQERLNEEWAQGAGAKRCPSCQVWLQKVEGCNHMICQCGTHLCWVCLETFSDDDNDNVYEHMHAAHGGIDGDEVVPVDLPQEQADFAFAQRLQAFEHRRGWDLWHPLAEEDGGDRWGFELGVDGWN